MSAPATSMFSPRALELARSMSLRMGKPNLEVFAERLLGLARSNRDLVVVTSDSRGSGKLGGFAQALPKQLVEVGIAEQNLVGISAGLASCGKTVFATSPACFLSARSLEQIKNDVCYSDNPVKLVGISAGVSYGALGSTHHSLHDLAALRAIHNLRIVVPADNAETRAAIETAARMRRPFYLRFGKAPLFDLPNPAPMGDSSRHASEGDPSGRASKGDPSGHAWMADPSETAPMGEPSGRAFEDIARARVLRDGDDAAIIATGETVIHALLAAELLKERSLRVRVLSVPTIKPLDHASILAAARTTRAVVTVEEHSVHGGLGEAVAALLMQAGVSVPFRIVGFPDEYTYTGSQAELFAHYGISMEGLERAVLELVAS